MHSLLLVTLEPADDANSESVRQQVYDCLLADPSICGDGGRFWSAPCDWFVIGGAWSGLLAETVMGGEFQARVRALTGTDGERLKQSDLERHAADLDALWQSLGGTAPNRYLRKDCHDYGHPDDAMLLSQPLYDALLSEHEGQDTDGTSFVDLDGDEISPGFIGRKWLVVVDYHS